MAKDLPGFPHKGVFGLGITQLVLCILIVLIGAIHEGVTYKNWFNYSWATEIWIPIICIAAGVTGVAAGKYQRKPLIIAHMVMSIAAALFAFILMCTASAMATPKYHFELLYIYNNNNPSYDHMYIPIAILAAIQIVIAHISACLCCRAVCCTPRRPGQTIVTRAVFQGQPTQTGRPAVFHQVSNNPTVITYGQPVGVVGHNQPGVVLYGQETTSPQDLVPSYGLHPPPYAAGPDAPPAYTP